MTGQAPTKVCVMCGDDVSSKPRTKDARGRYYCHACYERALSGQHARALQHPVAVPPTAPETARSTVSAARCITTRGGDAEDVGTYGLELGNAPESRNTTPGQAGRSGQPPTDRIGAPSTSVAAPASNVDRAAPPVNCPSCERPLPPGTLVCVDCGINVQTGRSILTAEQGDAEKLHERAREILWFASWLLWLGLLPISSEAHGSYKPWALRSIALLTVFTSMWMWWFDWTASPQMHQLKNLMMWVGDEQPDSEQIESFYQLTSYGDVKAFNRKKYELRTSVPESDLALAALRELPKSKQCFGEFHWWQLLTCAFLHADFVHLGGNLLFMLVFGSRINALIGNVATWIVYPILAIASSIPNLMFMSHQPPTPALGASGAIMGLAGMYLVFFPICKVHVAAFIRLPILLLGFFRCWGFWILLLFIGQDVAMTLLRAEDGVAHWAHMGGFAVGMAIAIALLLARAVNARGNDLISVALGRHAWALLGRPAQWLRQPEGEGWLTRWRIIPRPAAMGTADGRG